MYYEIYGEGQPLVLLHGFQGSGALWQPFIPGFARNYRVIVVDLRGHGRSTNPSNKFTHRQSALDIFALMDQLGIKTFKAIGVSSGGMTLLHMATQQPSRVEAMVLVDATTYFPEPAREIMRHDTVETISPQEWEFARKLHKYGDQQIRALRQEFHDFKDSYDDMNFTPPYLATITAQTLIIHGDHDQFFPVGIPMQMYCSIPNSFLWVIPHGGHVPIIERADDFTKLSLEFLSGAWSREKPGTEKPWPKFDCMIPQ
jgi:pimeloyl-ACP methyl ester carboxylesterase